MKLACVAALGLTLAGCQAPPAERGLGVPAPPPAPVAPGYAAFLPDPRLTPGATLPVTREQVCVRGYAYQVRSVTDAEKRAVYAKYGITNRNPGEFEIDHLISLELGGSNEIANLWAQSYLTQPWNAHVKDALEDRLHAEVCAGTIPLQQAQEEIRTDWIAAYKKHFGSEAPLPPHRVTQAGHSD